MTTTTGCERDPRPETAHRGRSRDPVGRRPSRMRATDRPEPRDRRTVLAAAAVSAALLAGLALPLEAQESSFQWSGRMAEGRTLRVEGISGDIRAVLAEGATARVTAEKHGDRDDFRDVEIVMEESRDGITICAVYGHPGARSCDHHHDHDDRGDHDNHDIDVSVDFEVYLPAGVDFRGSTVSGHVDVDGVRSDVRASTVSGDVFVSTTGVAWGSTVSGRIELDMGSGDWDDMDISTVSGDIVIWLPDGVGTEIDFESLSGDFESDFDLRVHHRDEGIVGYELLATLGDGSRDLRLHTVSGDVEVRRRRGGPR